MRNDNELSYRKVELGECDSQNLLTVVFCDPVDSHRNSAIKTGGDIHSMQLFKIAGLADVFQIFLVT